MKDEDGLNFFFFFLKRKKEIKLCEFFNEINFMDCGQGSSGLYILDERRWKNDLIFMQKRIQKETEKLIREFGFKTAGFS